MGATDQERLRFFDRREDMVPHASYEVIKEKLARAAEKSENGKTQPYRVVHLLCHEAELGSGAGYGLLLTKDHKESLDDLENTQLEKKTVSPDELKALFPNGAAAPRLVVLSACHGSDGGKPDARIGSAALAMHQAGIESVIASRLKLSKRGSTTLCREIYSGLLGDLKSVEGVMSAARAALGESNDHAALQLFQNTKGWDTRPVTFRPYRGLLKFGLEHQRYFCGRHKESQEACHDWEKLKDPVAETIDNLSKLQQGSRPRFLIIMAASGTGKSSMVFASVLPEFIKNGTFAADAWQQMRPEKDPMGALEVVLKRRKDPAKPFLLIVDQFEEVFTHIDKQEAHKRTEFVREQSDVSVDTSRRKT